ncbi:hypothetical protein [Amycolatopsis sp. cmx-4-68]|uniref:hypothetical protein n=1 Tax=Amycolatopsis sp. cmx-4-68 TaxID=2790938 RepID=UPI00397D7120
MTTTPRTPDREPPHPAPAPSPALGPGPVPGLPPSALGPTGLGTTAARILPKNGDVRPPDTSDRRVTP